MVCMYRLLCGFVRWITPQITDMLRILFTCQKLLVIALYHVKERNKMLIQFDCITDQLKDYVTIYINKRSTLERQAITINEIVIFVGYTL